MTASEPKAILIAKSIEGRPVRACAGESFRLTVTDLKPVRPRAGWYYLSVGIIDARGIASATPLMSGIVSGGGRGVMPWAEGRLYPEVRFPDGSTIDARALGLEAGMVAVLGDIIPAGGHLMIDYETPAQAGTHAELLLRIPPIASHLGAMMFRAGFSGEFKDWYFSEGGHEGPRKLQANKPPNQAAARAAMRTHVAELKAFARRPLPLVREQAAIVARAKARARQLLREYAR